MGTEKAVLGTASHDRVMNRTWTSRASPSEEEGEEDKDKEDVDDDEGVVDDDSAKEEDNAMTTALLLLDWLVFGICGFANE